MPAKKAKPAKRGPAPGTARPSEVGDKIRAAFLAKSEIPPRLCEGCKKEKTGGFFYTADDPLCRMCRKARKPVETSSLEAECAAHRLEKLTKQELATLAKRQATVKHTNRLAYAKEKKQVTLLEKEIASRTLARRSLLYFTKKMLPNYQAGWVHEDVCRRLEKFGRDVAAKKSPRLMLLVPPRHGKQLADSTRVPTPGGWKNHGDLRVGEHVFGSDGEPVRIVAVSEKTPSDMLVTLTDGHQIRCHQNHEWLVYERPRQRWVVKETHELQARQLWSSDRAVFQLPPVPALQFPETELGMDPYVLGAWLGDGSSTKPCITHSPMDTAVVDEIARRGYRSSAVCEHSTTGCLTTYFSGPRPNVPGRLSQELKALGLLGEKRIPVAFRFASVRQRLELLAGLVDTDGHVEPHSGRVRIVTASESLAVDISEVASTLGFRPYITAQQPALSSSGIQGRKVVYTVGFQPVMELPVVLARKKNPRLAPQRRIGIRSVEYSPNGEKGHCIQVDRADGLYIIGERQLTVTHNSELASIRFPAWHLGHYPSDEIINVGYNLDLPMIFSRKVREIVRDPVYKAIFEKTRMDTESQSVEAWLTTAGGGFLAAGRGGGLTGKGANILIIDDPLKNMEEADSIAVRDSLWEWYQSTAYTRLAPGGGVLVIETWWNDDDLAGRLQQAMLADPEADQFEVVRYPAIAEQDEYRLPSGAIVYEPAEDAELLREKGEALHSDRYPLASLNRIKATLDPRIWSALYQQNPTPDEGMYFRREYFRYEPVVPETTGRYVYQAWDFAIGVKKTNDYTVGCTLIQDETDSIHVVEVDRFKADSFVIVERMLDMFERWGQNPKSPIKMGVENGQLWMALKPLFLKRCQERRLYPSFEEMATLTDKNARARPLQGRMQQGKIVFLQNAPWLQATEFELLRFPAGAHDDIVDSLAWGAQLCVGAAPPRLYVPPPPKSWKDQLARFIAGSGARSHMAA